MSDAAATRHTMVDNQLRTIDVSDTAILDAMADVPREEFLPGRLKALAYTDQHHAIPGGSTAAPRFQLAPGPFAKMAQLAEIGGSDIVLIVGCPTGYSPAIIAQVANSVVALEEDSDLAERAGQSLTEQGIDNAAVVCGPLTDGWPKEGPYDAILLVGAVDTLPAALTDQLKDGGRLVVVEGIGNAGQARLYRRSGDDVSSTFGFNASLPPLPGFEVEKEFEF